MKKKISLSALLVEDKPPYKKSTLKRVEKFIKEIDGLIRALKDPLSLTLISKKGAVAMIEELTRIKLYFEKILITKGEHLLESWKIAHEIKNREE
jgi:hypothetical protein